MKKRTKIIICVVSLILILWMGMLICDFALMNMFQKPIFVMPTITADNGGGGRYQGLGYSFDIDGSFLPDADPYGIYHFRGYIFNLPVVEKAKG